MTRRRKLAVAATAGLLAASGGTAAIAASGGDKGKQREDSVLADAAKRLGKSPDELRKALADAQSAQLDADVKAGRLTQEQADQIKKRRAESGRVLGGPHLRFKHGGPGMRMRGGRMDALAKAIGITREQLRKELRAGKTIEQIAKAHGKSKADLRKAMKDELKRWRGRERPRGTSRAPETAPHGAMRLPARPSAPVQ